MSLPHISLGYVNDVSDVTSMQDWVQLILLFDGIGLWSRTSLESSISGCARAVHGAALIEANSQPKSPAEAEY